MNMSSNFQRIVCVLALAGIAAAAGAQNERPRNRQNDRRPQTIRQPEAAPPMPRNQNRPGRAQAGVGQRQAQQPQLREMLREHFAQMEPEARREAIQRLRDRFSQLPPDERRQAAQHLRQRLLQAGPHAGQGGPGQPQSRGADIGQCPPQGCEQPRPRGQFRDRMNQTPPNARRESVRPFRGQGGPGGQGFQPFAPDERRPMNGGMRQGRQGPGGRGFNQGPGLGQRPGVGLGQGPGFAPRGPQQPQGTTGPQRGWDPDGVPLGRGGGAIRDRQGQRLGQDPEQFGRPGPKGQGLENRGLRPGDQFSPPDEAHDQLMKRARDRAARIREQLQNPPLPPDDAEMQRRPRQGRNRV